MRLLIKILIPVLIVVIAIPVYQMQKPVSELCKGKEACFTGVMMKIVDGDTFTIDKQKVRLVLVDTPEKDEAGYQEAINFIEEICPIGSEVLVDQDDIQLNSFERMIAVVYCDDKILNEELVKNNFAVIDDRFCLKSEFGNETWAKEYGC